MDTFKKTEIPIYKIKTKCLMITCLQRVDVFLCVQVVEDTKDLLEKLRYSFEKRGPIMVKGKGVLTTYFLKEDLARRSFNVCTYLIYLVK